MACIAEGLLSFKDAERRVRNFDEELKAEVLEEQRKEALAKEEEFVAWKHEKDRKKDLRRKMGSVSERPKLSESSPNTRLDVNTIAGFAALQESSLTRSDLTQTSPSVVSLEKGGPTSVPPPAPAAPQRNVRKLAREATDKMSLHRSVVDKMKHDRAVKVDQSLSGRRTSMLLAAFLPADAGEHREDVSTSYIERDPTRVLPTLPAPTLTVLNVPQVFSGSNGTPAMLLLTKHFMREGKIERDAVMSLLRKATDILREEPNCVEVDAPCNVFGDVHGQYFDLLELIKQAGAPTNTKQLWLGDYVDRGNFGCEVVLLLAAAKVKWPKSVFLLRGNHESRSQTHAHNFEKECIGKYGIAAYDAFMELFDNLPLAAVVNSAHGRFFCVHGGLSPMIRSPLDLDRLERFEEPPLYGPTCDLLWSDPLDTAPDYQAASKKGAEDEYFLDNHTRGCGQLFGHQAVLDFLQDNEMVCVIRAHEVQKDGFRMHRFHDDSRPVPMCITLFSAPNYCGSYENQGAFLFIADASHDIRQIGWTDPPFAVPGGNVINKTMPMVAEAILGFFLSILELLDDDDGTEEEDSSLTPQEREEEKLAEALFAQKVENLGRKVAGLRVERKAVLASICPLRDESAETEGDPSAVFQRMQEIDKKKELRRK